MSDDEYTVPGAHYISTDRSLNIGAPPSGWNLEEEKILPNRFSCANAVHTVLNDTIRRPNRPGRI